MEWAELGITPRAERGRYAIICPNCNDTRTKHRGVKCLTINDVDGNRWFKCNHPPCAWSGSLEDMDKFAKVREGSKMPSMAREFSLQMREFITSRGISMATAKKAKLYENHNTLCFPFFMRFTLVNVKFLNTVRKKGDWKWKQLQKDLGTLSIPFLIDHVSMEDEDGNPIANRTVIITEGEWDALTWVECEYANIVSVPQGAPSLKAKDFKKEFAYLHDPYVKRKFKDVERFIISVDADAAGVNLRHHIVKILGKEKCQFVEYPAGYKDINEVLIGNPEKNLPALGRPGVVDCYEKIRNVPIEGVITPIDAKPEIDKVREDGFYPGYGCGVAEVDELFTVKPKHITFVTGIPGAGKSVWVRWWMVTMCLHNETKGLKWALFTPENRPVAREYAKIAEVLTGKPISKKAEGCMTDEEYESAVRWINKHFVIIAPDNKRYESFGGAIDSQGVNTMVSILKYLEFLIKTEGIFGYVIDAWNKIEHLQPRNQSETTFISQQLDRLIQFGDYWDVHGIVVAHPRKIDDKDFNYKMPTLYDVKGSSAWKEKADIGIIVHRYKYRKLNSDDFASEVWAAMDDDEKFVIIPNAATIIRTEKIRFEETGKELRIRMVMESISGQFHMSGLQTEGRGAQKVEGTVDDRIEPKKNQWEDPEQDEIFKER